MTHMSPITRPSADAHIARLALCAASILRDIDAVALRDLGEALDAKADQGRIHPFADNSQLVRIMQRLGWRKDGYVGEGAGRSPLYRRVATPAREA